MRDPVDVLSKSEVAQLKAFVLSVVGPPPRKRRAPSLQFRKSGPNQGRWFWPPTRSSEFKYISPPISLEQLNRIDHFRDNLIEKALRKSERKRVTEMEYHYYNYDNLDSPEGSHNVAILQQSTPGASSKDSVATGIENKTERNGS